jgi:hypothetical protein
MPFLSFLIVLQSAWLTATMFILEYAEYNFTKFVKLFCKGDDGDHMRRVSNCCVCNMTSTKVLF